MNNNHPAEVKSGRCQVLSKAAFSGISADILVGGDNAPMTVMDLTVAPDSGAPAHISMTEDKVFLIKEGCFIFLVGEEKIKVHAGDRVFVRLGKIHSFSVLGQSCGSMTLVSTPGKHDQFFQAMSELAIPHAVEEVESVCSRFDQVVVGPVVSA
jgi:quercetin dioxygenase-like cupin family protein